MLRAGLDVGAFGAVVGLLLGFNVGGLRDRLKGLSSGGRIRSLAVLPLENPSGHSTQKFLLTS
jgi:hypothetical protein